MKSNGLCTTDVLTQAACVNWLDGWDEQGFEIFKWTLIPKRLRTTAGAEWSLVKKSTRFHNGNFHCGICVSEIHTFMNNQTK